MGDIDQDNLSVEGALLLVENEEFCTEISCCDDRSLEKEITQIEIINFIEQNVSKAPDRSEENNDALDQDEDQKNDLKDKEYSLEKIVDTALFDSPILKKFHELASSVNAFLKSHDPLSLLPGAGARVPSYTPPPSYGSSSSNARSSGGSSGVRASNDNFYRPGNSGTQSRSAANDNIPRSGNLAAPRTQMPLQTPQLPQTLPSFQLLRSNNHISTSYSYNSGFGSSINSNSDSSTSTSYSSPSLNPTFASHSRPSYDSRLRSDLGSSSSSRSSISLNSGMDIGSITPHSSILENVEHRYPKNSFIEDRFSDDFWLPTIKPPEPEAQPLRHPRHFTDHLVFGSYKVLACVILDSNNIVCIPAPITKEVIDWHFSIIKQKQYDDQQLIDDLEKDTSSKFAPPPYKAAPYEELKREQISERTILGWTEIACLPSDIAWWGMDRYVNTIKQQQLEEMKRTAGIRKSQIPKTSTDKGGGDGKNSTDGDTYFELENHTLTKTESKINQMNQEIRRGQSPKGVLRVDKGKVACEQDHVHFNNKAALNKDGTWKEGHAVLTKEQKTWLQQNGWRLPNE